MNYRIGVDGGGTTTRAVLIDAGHNVLARAEGDSSNYFNVGLEAATAHIRRAIDAVLTDAGVAEASIEGYGVALAGVVSEREQALVGEALKPVLKGGRLVVDEDAAAALAGAFGGGPGAIMIAGTGANCFGIDEAGLRARADGWGPLLGDRGSGYSIGENALRAICRAHDGTEPPTSLTGPVLASFGAASVEALVPVVYAPDFRRDRIAAVVPLVLEQAAAGDAAATRILETAGRELAATAAAVLKKLGVTRIAPVGGVISRPSPLRGAFEARLQATFPNIEIAEPFYDAAIGAALLVRA